MTEEYLTVGQLRAELVGLADDTPVVLLVDDPAVRGTVRWLDAISAGYGAGTSADDPILSRAFPIRATTRTDR